MTIKSLLRNAVRRISNMFAPTPALKPAPVRRTNAVRARILMLAVLLVLATNADAQYFGLRGGVERSQIVSNLDSGTIGTETGITLGAFVNIPLPKRFGIGVEGMYSQKVVTQQNLVLAQSGTFEPDASLELGYLEVPILLQYRFPLPGLLKPRLFAGPVIGVVVNESVDLKGKSPGDIANESAVLTRDAFADKEVGYTVGASASLGFKLIPVKFIFDLRYVAGVASIRDDFAGNPMSRDLNVGAFSGTIGLGF